MLPGRISLFPSLMPHVVGLVVIIPIIAVSLFGGRRPFWLRAERAVILLFFIVAMAATTANLTKLEASVSLATIVVVASRAINILGS